MTNIQSTLRTAPDLCKSAALQCYLVVTVIHMQSVGSRMCVCVCVYIYIYIYTCSSQYRDAGRAKEINVMGEQ